MTFLRVIEVLVVAFVAAVAVDVARTPHPRGKVGASDECAVPGVSADSSFREFLVKFEGGANLFMNGDPDLWMSMSSHEPDVTLLNPFGFVARGWPQVGTLYRNASKRFVPSGARASLEYLATGVEGNLAYTVTIQRVTVRRVGEPGPSEGYTRSTNIFRREHCQWKLVHRQMDHTRTPE